MRWPWLVLVTAGCHFDPADAAQGDAAPPAVDAIDAPIGPPIPIQFVQAQVDFQNGSSSSIERNFDSAQTAGNLNIVVVSCTCNNLNVSSVTDSRLNGYAAATPVRSASGSLDFQLQIFFAPDIAAGQNTITVQLAADVNDPKLRIFEYAGLATTDPLDGETGGSGEGVALDSGSLTTTNAHDLLFAANVVATVTTTGSPGFAQRQLDDGDLVEDREISAIGTHAATAAQSSSGSWIMQLVAFKGAR